MPESPALIAALPAAGNWVLVGPPLSVSAPSLGSPFTSELWVNPHVPPCSRLKPFDVIAVSQLAEVGLAAVFPETIELLDETEPVASWIPPPLTLALFDAIVAWVRVVLAPAFESPPPPKVAVGEPVWKLLLTVEFVNDNVVPPASIPPPLLAAKLLLIVEPVIVRSELPVSLMPPPVCAWLPAIVESVMKTIAFGEAASPVIRMPPPPALDTTPPVMVTAEMWSSACCWTSKTRSMLSALMVVLRAPAPVIVSLPLLRTSRSPLLLVSSVPARVKV